MMWMPDETRRSPQQAQLEATWWISDNRAPCAFTMWMPSSRSPDALITRKEIHT